MDTLDEGIKDKILTYLKTAPNNWAHTSQIGTAIGHNRITIGKYLEIMKAHSLVATTLVGKAKMWKLVDTKIPLILIADDEPHIRNLMKLSLDKKYNFLECETGEEVLESVVKQTPDLILLDVMMPKLDGYATLKQLKQNPLTKNIPTILISAKAQIADKIEGLALGADEYLIKPFDPQELNARVEAALRKEQANQNLNTITQLPDKILTQERLYRSGVGSHIKINGFTEYNKKYGFKGGTQLLQLFAKLLVKRVCEIDFQAFIGHCSTTHFIVVTEKPVDLDLKTDIDSFLVYIAQDSPISITNKTFKSPTTLKELGIEDVTVN
ncbi:MAG: CheY-like chemotaxis protein [Candidatus Woesearchaeota archaeon]|jgi:CheY-like chemotaxis protein